jgi:hypothetical protein
VDTTERGDRGVKGGPKTGWRQGYFTDNSSRQLLFNTCGEEP